MTWDTFMFLVTNRVTPNNRSNLYIHRTNYQVSYHGTFFTGMSTFSTIYIHYTLEKFGFYSASEDI